MSAINFYARLPQILSVKDIGYGQYLNCEPYSNPQIELLRKKLRAQKVAHEEKTVEIDGKLYQEFRSTNAPYVRAPRIRKSKPLFVARRERKEGGDKVVSCEALPSGMYHHTFANGRTVKCSFPYDAKAQARIMSEVEKGIQRRINSDFDSRYLTAA